MSKVNEILDASRAGNLSRVSALLDEDPALASAASMLGSQPAHAAYFSGHRDVFDLLLSRGVSLDPGLCAELGMLDRVRAAVEANPELVAVFGPQGSTLLHRASYWGQTAAASYLLERGADPNAPTRDNFLQIRPLGCAVATPDVPSPSDSEDTVLELVSLLLQRGADVNGRRRDGLTALHGAAYRGHLRVIAYLLEHGGDPGIRGYDGAGPHAGQSARDLALAQSQEEAAVILA